MKVPWEWAAAAVIPLAVLYVLAAATPPTAPDFKERVLLCDKAPSPDRMPCYKWAIADMWARGMDLREIAAHDQYTREPYVSPGDPGSPFGNNCHTFYHALGDFIAESVTREPVKAMALDPATCTGGAYMATLHRLDLIYNHSLDRLRQIYRACPDVPAICAHVVGHALFEKHVGPILKYLDDISRETYHKPVPPYDYSNDGNISAAFAECPQVVEPGVAVQQCYTGIAHSLYLTGEHLSENYLDLLAQCDRTPGFRNECRANFALRWGFGAVSPILISSNSTGAVAECALLGPDLQADCHRGVGGGLGLWIEAQTLGAERDIMTRENASAFILHYVDLCRRMAPEHVPACIRGMVGTPRFNGLYLRSGLMDRDVDAAIASKPIPIGA